MLARLFVCLLVTITIACGDDPVTPDENTVTLPNGTFSGTLNGEPYIPVGAVVGFNGTNLVSFGTADAQGRGISIVAVVIAPGTVNIANGTASDASTTEGTAVWRAGGGTFGTGTVHFTILSTERVAATYTLNMLAYAGTSATGSRTATGSFNLTTGQ